MKSFLVQNASLQRAERIYELYKKNYATNHEHLYGMREQIKHLVQIKEHEEQRWECKEHRKEATEEAILMSMDLSRMIDQQWVLYN